MKPGRQRLLEAGLREFAHRGYDAAVTRTITDDAGVTAPTLYHHFGNKAGLFEAVAAEVMDRVLAAMTEAVVDASTTLELVDATLDASLRLQAHEPDVPRFVVVAPLDLARHPELAGAAPQMSRLRDFLQATFAGHDAALGDVVLTQIYGLSRFAVHQDRASFARTVEAVRAVLHGSLRP